MRTLNCWIGLCALVKWRSHAGSGACALIMCRLAIESDDWGNSNYNLKCFNNNVVLSEIQMLLLDLLLSTNIIQFNRKGWKKWDESWWYFGRRRLLLNINTKKKIYIYLQQRVHIIKQTDTHVNNPDYRWKKECMATHSIIHVSNIWIWNKPVLLPQRCESCMLLSWVASRCKCIAGKLMWGYGKRKDHQITIKKFYYVSP